MKLNGPNYLFFPALVIASILSVLSPAVLAQTTFIGSSCSRPGHIDDNHCTVLYHITNNPSNNIVCLWRADTNVVHECQGVSRWGAGYDFVPPTGATLEFRRHTQWPTQNPLIHTNPAAVRTSGTLLRTQVVINRYRAPKSSSCGVVLSPGQSIQAALNSNIATICLSPGSHPVTSTISIPSNKTLRGTDPANPAVMVPNLGGAHVLTALNANNIDIRDIRIEGSDPVRPGFGILVQSSSNVLIERVTVNRTTIGIGVNTSSSNVEVRSSAVNFAGDGLACTGCANPSVWINDSSDVRMVKSRLTNLGVGPQGDGELACYNTPNLYVSNTTIQGSGASGMYVVNCDYAVITGNDIIGAREWGLDIVETGYASGSDYGLYSWNLIQNSRNAAGVIRNSIQATFQSNHYLNNRQGGSGSCNGINRRNNTTGYYFINDTASPWPVVCND